MPRKKKDYGFKPFQKMPGSIDKKFTRIHESLFESKAWGDLTVHAQILYISMIRKYNGSNERNIMFKQDEGEKIMGKNTFHKCIKELVSHGFIDYVEHNKFTRLANIFGFSTNWHSFTPSKKENAADPLKILRGH
jgi:hypothetical protein